MTLIGKLSTNNIRYLLNSMKIKNSENTMNAVVSFYNGKLHVIHGKRSDGKIVESIYTDFYIEKLYGYSPSAYDQERFHNVMREFYNTKQNPHFYDQYLKAFCTKHKLSLNENIIGESFQKNQ